jgi:short subunit dehydrogenase-like uncharacterized protein
MAETKPFDIVLFGATGFTGKLTAEYLARATTPRPLRWAIAGRSRDKLDALARDLSAHTAHAPEILLADVDDAPSLHALARVTRVVITTVGPYIKYGEPLVKACVDEGAHYVDLTGEPEFVDGLITRYHAQAEARGVKIVNACGFDSIPHDLGAYFTLQALRQKLPEKARDSTPIEIEGVVRAKGNLSGGTWHSAVTAMARMRSYEKEKKARGPLPLVGPGRKVGALPSRIQFEPSLSVYKVPMPTIDPQVVRRSARLLPEYGPQFRYGHYVGVKKLASVAGLLAGVSSMFVLAQFPPTRELLLKFKDPGQGPSEEERKNAFFKVTFLARGGEQQVRCEVRGGDPGYTETAKMLSESALCLAFDGDRLPSIYGVVPPAAAFGNTLIERLRAAGITFAVDDGGKVEKRSASRDAAHVN